MIRFIYTVMDLLGAVCAIISPVCILHWLLKAINFPAAAPVVNALNPVFNPLNALVEFFIKTPPLQFNGDPVPTAQGVLAALLTIAFFALNFASESLKATEQKMKITKESFQQKRRLDQLKRERESRERAISTNRRVFAYVQYEFMLNQQCATFFETGFSKWGGRSLETLPTSMSIEFDTLDHALKYAEDMTRQVLGHYTTLRPIDPQPPFRIGVEAIEKDQNTVDGIAGSRNLMSYAGNNQTIFTQSVKELMDALGTTHNYNFQSQGMYPMGGSRTVELFRLVVPARR